MLFLDVYVWKDEGRRMRVPEVKKYLLIDGTT